MTIERVSLVMVIVCIMAFAAMLHADDSIKDFTQQTLDGKTIKSETLKGMPMVINIGAHWWQQCKTEAPALQNAYLTYGKKGVIFLGIFVRSKDDEIKKFVETYKMTFPVGREDGIAEKLRVRGIPVTVFVAKDGRIVKRHIGVITQEELASDIEAILK